VTRELADDPLADDPFAVLGLDATATLADLRAARRRLALELHPDLHPGADGTEMAMQRVNAAFDRCVGHVTGRRPLAGGSPNTASTSSGPSTGGPPPTSSRRRPAPPPRRFHRVEHDTPSFTIDALPAEAFEALLVVCSWIGEVVDDDPPYVLDCLLSDPSPCWCRLELVPDAGGSTVSLSVAPAADLDERPTAEQVRDVWVAQLNRLGRPLP
jgi:hypothetical protein